MSLSDDDIVTTSASGSEGPGDGGAGGVPGVHDGGADGGAGQLHAARSVAGRKRLGARAGRGRHPLTPLTGALETSPGLPVTERPLDWASSRAWKDARQPGLKAGMRSARWSSRRGFATGVPLGGGRHRCCDGIESTAARGVAWRKA